MSKTPSAEPDNYLPTTKGKTPQSTTFSESEQKLGLVLQYIRNPKCLRELCRAHGRSRQDIHNWFKLLRARADLIFEHGSTIRKKARLAEANDALRRKIIDLEQTVSELRAELDELKSPSGED
jgi:transposase-like protein